MGHKIITMSNNLPSAEQLQRALQISEQIEKLEAALKAVLGGTSGAKVTVAAPAPTKRKGKRTMSPEARERIAAAQRARWAKAKGGKAAKAAPANGEAPAAVKGKKAKRKISAQARARMAAAAKKRWAKVKKAKA